MRRYLCGKWINNWCSFEKRDIDLENETIHIRGTKTENADRKKSYQKVYYYI